MRTIKTKYCFSLPAFFFCTAWLILVFILPNIVSGQIFSSVDDEKEVGEKMAKQVEQQIGLYDNPELTRYVQDIGARLVGKLNNP